MDMRKLLSYTRKAVDDYNMIKEGDKIAIGISGGKDSLALALALKGLQRFYPKKFELQAIMIDLGFDYADFTILKNFFEKHEIPFTIINTSIGEIVFEERKEKNPCSLCSKMRKGAFNEAAIKFGCNKVALGHHKNDIIETLFLCMFFEGRIYSFSPVTYLDKMNLYAIRPLLYTSEREVIAFKNKFELPVMKNPCPADGYTKREYIKDLLKKLNKENPGLNDRIFKSITNSNINGWDIKEFLK